MAGGQPEVHGGSKLGRSNFRKKKKQVMGYETIVEVER
jgi:hypothetical protein